jgi:hypothetical protein
MDVKFESLAALPHIDSVHLNGRIVLLVPLWEEGKWRTWLPLADDTLFEADIHDVARAHYLGKSAAREEDICITFLEFMWQHMSWPTVAREVTGLGQDVHLMATIAAKLEHYHAARGVIGTELLASFVNAEIEHLLVVARSAFDLLQAAIAHLWNDHIRLADPERDELRRQRRMPTTFSHIVLKGQELRTPEEIAERFTLPAQTAAMYTRHGEFFRTLRDARDHVVHFGKTPDSVYATERGFCVSPTAPYFRDFPWGPEHHFNENIVTLVPWVARVVFQTLEACSDILATLPSHIQFPPAVAPGLRLFLRDPANAALMRLFDAWQGPKNWWHEAPGNSPKSGDG